MTDIPPSANSAPRGPTPRWPVILGALLGGFVGSFLFGWDVTGINIGSIVLAFLGAVLFLLILRAIPGRQPLER